MADRLTKMIAFVKTAELGSFSQPVRALAVSSPMIQAPRWRTGAGPRRAAAHANNPYSNADRGRTTLSRRGGSASVPWKPWEAADAIVAETAQEPRGTLRITAPVEIGAAVLTPKLPEFPTIYPEATIELVLDDRVIDLVAENFDVSSGSGSCRIQGLIAPATDPVSPRHLRVAGLPRKARRAAGPG